MHFRILGLDPAPFLPLYGLPDEQLARQGITRITVTEPHSAPDRVELRDAEPGERVLLLNHEYLPGPGPYAGRHAIFVREGAVARFEAIDEVPACMQRRLMSLRAFDRRLMMVDADVCEGQGTAELIERLFARPEVAFIHAHHARRGCYAGRVERG